MSLHKKQTKQTKRSRSPKDIQFTATKESLPRLKKYIYKRRKSTTFKIVPELPEYESVSKIPERRRPSTIEYLKSYTRKAISIANKHLDQHELNRIVESLRHDKLKYLSLDNVELSGDMYIIAKELETNKSLVEFNLKKSLRDEPDALAAIGDALMKNDFLRSLNLSYNEIDDEDLEELIYVFGINKALIKVDLSHNDITDYGATKLYHMLLRSFSSLLEINLTGNEEINANTITKINKVLNTKFESLGT